MTKLFPFLDNTAVNSDEIHILHQKASENSHKIIDFIHPLSVPVILFRGNKRRLEPIPDVTGLEVGYISCQSITGLLFKDEQPVTLTPTGNLASPINPTSMSLDVGGENIQKEHASSNRYLSTLSDQDPNQEPGSSANYQSTIQSPILIYHL